MSQLGEIDGQTLPLEFEGEVFTESDITLIALLCDPVYCAELLWEDPGNHEHNGCYKVRDYQYPLFRDDETYRISACARSVGKTESIKAQAQAHVFRRVGQNMLITAPELIHLLPLTDAIEDNFRDSRLIREFLDTRGGKTGFTHRPFGVDFIDGTKIVGRIPKLTGTGVKGQHQPDLRIDEGQDYPDRGWAEVHETVMKDSVDREGNPDFTYHVYGVHSGQRGGQFYKITTQGAFKLVNITALMRPGWGASEKEAAKAMYGGTSSPDYRRNILGEPGSAASAFFVIARLMACVDQGKDGQPDRSDYNNDYKDRGNPVYRAEEVDELGLPMQEILDLPEGYKAVYGGMDIGLAESPTVITLFAHCKVGSKNRLKLIRKITLERFRAPDIRKVLYAIGWHFGENLKGFGVDSTGLGYPIMQEMEDDELAPKHLLDVMRGYFFNSKVPVGVQKDFIVEGKDGTLKDQYGSAVKEEVDPLTGVKRYVVYMPMIEASTRYLREFVDTTYLHLPFDPEIVMDMQGESQQRVKHVAGLKRKPNAFHILDAMRAMAMAYKSGEVEEALAVEAPQPVFDLVL